MKLLYVNILKCVDDSYYVGITNNLSRRLEEHNNARNPESYTASRRPVVLIYYKEFTDFYKAIQTEKQIKGWSRKKKEALINGNFDELKDLAKKKFKNESLPHLDT